MYRSLTVQSKRLTVPGEIISRFEKHGFDALIAIGGDGSLTMANELAKRGNIRLVGVPKTIDNDLEAQSLRSVSIALSVLPPKRLTLHSRQPGPSPRHGGGSDGTHCRWIALNAGVAGTADVVLIPGPYDMRACG